MFTVKKRVRNVVMVLGNIKVFGTVLHTIQKLCGQQERGATNIVALGCFFRRSGKLSADVSRVELQMLTRANLAY